MLPKDLGVSAVPEEVAYCFLFSFTKRTSVGVDNLSFIQIVICDRPTRNESEVPSGCLELERKMGVGGVRCRF